VLHAASLLAHLPELQQTYPLAQGHDLSLVGSWSTHPSAAIALRSPPSANRVALVAFSFS
jgi:hypothetical protein